MPPELEAHIGILRAEGFTVDVIGDDSGGRFYVVLRGFEFPSEHFSPGTSDLMVMTDYQYPGSAMDMFWTWPEIRCTSGQLPQNADQFESYGGLQWQRWSWHYNQPWVPGRDTLISHIEFVRDRLARNC